MCPEQCIQKDCTVYLRKSALYISVDLGYLVHGIGFLTDPGACIL